MKAIVRPPSPRLSEGLLTHLDRRPVDAALAAEQWAAYVAAMAMHGWEMVAADVAPDCPDGVFVEDAAVVFGDLCVLTHPGAPERRTEVASVEALMVELGMRIARIDDAGTLDGGDVLKVDRRVYVGVSGRTDRAGIASLAALIEPEGYAVTPVPTTRVLHLKSAVTALPDGRVIGYDEHVDDPGVFQSYLSVPEPDGAHVVDLGDGCLLMAASAPQTAAQFAALGYEPVVVDISEFEKLEGCVTCLSVRVRT